MHWRGLSCLIHSSILVVLFGIQICGGVYLNQWAVHVQGGASEAKRVALETGFSYRGQVGSLEDYYVFEHHQVAKRSTSTSEQHHQTLSSHPEVKWVAQQYAKRRVKRDRSKKWDPHFTDEKWPDMWYLHGGAHGGYDMNVIGAWKRGYTGKGIVVTILDDGIERTHEDLRLNYDPDASWDINNNDDDPTPRYDRTDENRHGTRCAGEVAAFANNTKCVVGVAYKARIGGVRMLDGDVSDVVESSSLSLNPQHIDIYSASWGPDDDGRVVDGPAQLAKHAFIQGVLKGRGGKGSIYVWASGNGGNAYDSCNCDGYTNSIFTLSISSASEWGKKPWYLEECSSTLATTYSSGDNVRDRKIISTDLHNRCTSSHTGTSASAPLAAGLCALALEANPSLSWRDMQYIVMMTAKTAPLQDGNWIINGVGRRVSHRYGYGLMDAGGMVELAEKWHTVPEQHICLTPTLSVQKPIVDKGVQVDVSTEGCLTSTDTETHIRYLEHVQAKVTLEYSRRGDLQIHLRSPSGTRSTLLPRRKKDYIDAGFTEWPFMSTHFWGENPKGRWILEIENVGSQLNKGVLKKWQLILYGVASNPVQLKSNVSVKPGSNKSSTVPPLYECSPECAWRCTGPNPQDCIDCKNFRLGTTGPCVPQCPDGTYGEHRSRLCRRCHSSCHTCKGRRDSDCLSCNATSHLMELKGTCVNKCPKEYYLDTDGVCRVCSTLCLTCSGDATKCTTCEAGLQLVNERCTTDCPEAHYKDMNTKKCMACHKSCQTCLGPSASQCSSCHSNSLYQQGMCISQCYAGFFQIQTVGRKECRQCRDNCLSCVGAQDCSKCTESYAAIDGQCVAKMANGCPYGYFMQHDGQCRSCDQSCDTCRGETRYDCLTCHSNRFLDGGECVMDCSDGFYKSEDRTRECLPCHITCRRCRGRLASECTACLRDFTLENGRCLSHCQPGEFPNEHGQCSACDKSCAECHGPLNTQCLSCGRGQLLLNGHCTATPCPARYYQRDGQCHTCHKSCHACTGDSPNACTSCPKLSELQGGACIAQRTCPSHQFFDHHHQQCGDCHPSCTDCNGPLAEQCVTPTPQNKISQMITNKLLGNLYTTNIITGVISVLAFIIIVIITTLSINRLRVHKKCCWKNEYSRVPALYTNGLDTVHLMVGEMDDDDEDEEMETSSLYVDDKTALTSSKLQDEKQIYSTKVISNGR